MVGKAEGLLDATVGTGARVVGARVGAGDKATQAVPDPVNPFQARKKVTLVDKNVKLQTEKFLPTHLHCICN